MQEFGDKREIQCFESGMIDNARPAIEEGRFEQPYWSHIVFGERGGGTASVNQLMHMVEQLPSQSLWSVGASGRAQLPMNMAPLVMGGHVRTALEDNHYRRRGRKASNAELTGRLIRLAHEVGRGPATPAEARAMLGLG